MTLIYYDPPFCPAAQPVLAILNQPKQNQAEGGTAKIKVNTTEVCQEMGLLVHVQGYSYDQRLENVDIDFNVPHMPIVGLGQ